MILKCLNYIYVKKSEPFDLRCGSDFVADSLKTLVSWLHFSTKFKQLKYNFKKSINNYFLRLN